jgi:predicted CXXCH cytochrome family protein
MRGRTLLIAGLLTVAYAGQAAAQITGTEHDLSASGPTAGNAGDNGEICVYCHTPHGSNATIEAPLWNKPSISSTYTSYSSTTIDGVRLDVGSVSLACLTCHDGSQAMDAVVNAPGMGLGDGNLGDGLVFMTGVALLGTDLSNDHPIGIQYGGFDSIDPDFVDDTTVTATSGLATATINSLPRWWVNTTAGGNLGRDKEDMILYTRDNGGTNEPFVECASCHDPHEDNSANPAQVNFLRISNDSSDLCLACHIK